MRRKTGLKVLGPQTKEFPDTFGSKLKDRRGRLPVTSTDLFWTGWDLYTNKFFVLTPRLPPCIREVTSYLDSVHSQYESVGEWTSHGVFLLV